LAFVLLPLDDANNYALSNRWAFDEWATLQMRQRLPKGRAAPQSDPAAEYEGWYVTVNAREAHEFEAR
jgi:hypothetical protein